VAGLPVQGLAKIYPAGVSRNHQMKSRIKPLSRTTFKPKYKMGDWNKDNTLRFWAYMKGAESWVTPERFDKARAAMHWK
jgi:hypothetical protein